MANIVQTAISSIRKKADEMLGDNQGWFRGGQFTPKQNLQDWGNQIGQRWQQGGGISQFSPAQFTQQTTNSVAQNLIAPTMGNRTADIVQKTVQNRITNPILNVPSSIKQTVTSAPGIITPFFNNKLSVGEKFGQSGSNFLKTGGGLLNTLGGLSPLGPEDILMAGYDVGKAKLAGKSGINALTGEEYTGLGEATQKLGTPQALQTGLNYAEIPLILAGGTLLSKKKALQSAEELIAQRSKLVKLAETQPNANITKAIAGIDERLAKIPRVKPVDPIESLKVEAKKYKSAEEFVKNNIDDYVKSTKEYKDWAKDSKNIIEAYHGTPYSFDNFEIGKKQAGVYDVGGISFASEPKNAEPFSRQYPDWYYTKLKELRNKYSGISEIEAKIKKIDDGKNIRSVEKIKEEGNSLANYLNNMWSKDKDWLYNGDYGKFKDRFESDFRKISELQNELQRARNYKKPTITKVELNKLNNYKKELSSLENSVEGNIYKTYIKGKNIIDENGENIGFGSTREGIVGELNGDILRIKDADTGQYIGEEIIVNNPNQTFIVNSPKYKSQLTDIWNKSQLEPKIEGGIIPQKEIVPQTGQIKTKLSQDIETKTQELNQITDPVQKIITALKESKPLRGEQEQIYSAERAKKFAKMMSARGRSGGESGFYKELGALKGEMPKVQFESLRNSLNQGDVDTLFNRINEANIGDWEKITAKTGLSKILGIQGGSVPTRGELSLLDEVYGKEFTRAILDKRTDMQKLMATLGDALNLPRALMASLDMSAPLRQGVFLVGRPKQWVPAFKEMFKSFASEKAYNSIIENISSRPTYNLMRESKLAITKPNSVLAQGEETFLSNFAERIPLLGKGVAASDRAYSGFLNKLRADTFDDLVSKAKDSGVEVNKQILDNIANFVNTATGRGKLPGGLEKASSILSGTLFSPRLVASRMNLLNPAYYASLDTFTRKEALKSLFSFAASGLTVLGLAKAAGAEVGSDPRSSDFGKIKVGNTRYDIWGGFQQYPKIASQMITGKLISSTTGKEFTLGEGYKPITRADILTRFVESKESPVLSFVTSLLKGQNALGDKFNLPAELINRVTPMMVQDMYDLSKEWGPKGVLMGIPGIFGVGSQTYGKQIPTMTTTPTGKPKVSFESPRGLAEDILGGFKTQSNIPQEQWPSLISNKENKDQASLIAEKVKSGQASPSQMGNYIVDGEGEILDLVKLDDINNLPTTNRYQSAIRESKQYSEAAKIFDNTNLSYEQQQTALARLGISPDKASYYQVANDNDNLKTMFVLDAINKVKTQGGGFSDVLQLIANQRTDINGKMIASNGVLDNLVDEGILTYAQAKELKKYDMVDGKLTAKRKSVGRVRAPKKVSLRKMSTKGMIKRAKVKGIKVPKLKFKTIKPKKLKVLKVANRYPKIK